MNISRQVVLSSTIVCCMIVLSLAVPLAYADKKANFDACLKLGGSVKACCAGVGGTYDKQPGGEVCSWVEDKKLTADGGNPGEGLLHIRPPTGAEISSLLSDGQSQAGDHGLQQEIVYPDLIVQAINFTPTAESPDAYTVTVKNQGASTADLSSVGAQGYYDAVAGTWPGSVAACGSTFTTGTTLAPGSTIDLPVPCTVDPPSGDGWLVVKVDSGDILTEADETNNVTSVALAPDLVIQAISQTAPANYPPYSYTVTVKNQGASTANLSGVDAQGYYDDVAGTWPGSLAACGSTFTSGTTLAPGATTELVVGCEIAPSSKEYLVVKIDAGNILSESDETNNVFSIDVLQIQ
jgi:hypothetical protein